MNPRISGYAIEALKADVGDHVEKGQVLAVLDTTTLDANLTQAKAEVERAQAAVRQAQSEIDSAKASYDQARQTLQRAQKLQASGTTSEANLTQARSGADTAKAAYASAQDGLAVAKAQLDQAQSKRDMAGQDLDRAQIRTPVAGVVATRNAELGAIASTAGEPMFTVFENGEIEASVQVMEGALDRIKVGDAVDLTTASGKSVTGTVRRVAPTVDAETRLADVRVTLKGNATPPAGTFTSGWIITDRHMATTVPAEAVLTREDGTQVKVVDDGVVHDRPVVAGIVSPDGRREIVEGLQPGETVLARAGAFFNDGDAVKAVPADAKGGDSQDKQTAER
ncbi:efflux RND transporter periplasmic adaptor subunit [Pararhizobium mangrovi]|uniref:Efflux RND transporter periplasmic adaptor subunit n=1 Tax=Pararhizobium mangrovi TaxID=2590452 RepID=A0A506UFV0_9HYPH|nr:efflux RND transporter periplasmic adaptor subunit [Pararhizobium mangrovi]